MIVSPPGRDLHDSHSSRLAEATEKALGTIALSNCFWCIIWFLPQVYPRFTKSFLKSLAVIIIVDNLFCT